MGLTPERVLSCWPSEAGSPQSVNTFNSQPVNPVWTCDARRVWILGPVACGGNDPFSAPPLPNPEHLEVDDSREGWQSFLSLVILGGLRCILKGRAIWQVFYLSSMKGVHIHCVTPGHLSHVPTNSHICEGLDSLLDWYRKGTSIWGIGICRIPGGWWNRGFQVGALKAFCMTAMKDE